MKIYLLIQARSSSTRLPFKSLLKIKNYFSIELLYKRVRSKNYNTLVLTSKDKSDEYLSYMMKKKKIPFYRGDLLNVRNRFLKFKKNLKPNDILIRLTGDNLFVDKNLIKKLLNKIIKEKKNYVFVGNQFLNIPYGISAEAFKFSMLNEKKSFNKRDKEHVTYSFKRNPNNIISVNENDGWKKLNCSIDYLKDFKIVNNIFKKIKNPTKARWNQLCFLLKKYSQLKQNIKTDKINLVSLKSKDLSSHYIKKILKLKQQQWNYSLKSQYDHFLKEYNKDDINNMIFYGKKLIGYTILKNKKIKFNSINKLFLLLDTIIIDLSFRKKNFGEILMCFNNNEILKSNKTAILQCKNSHIMFYKKNFWTKNNLSQINFNQKNKKLNLMLFNKN
jgi:spore coat polysaccharide biosynthesis protein SpsF